MKTTLSEAGAAIETDCRNAVVLERSFQEEGDIKIHREQAVRALVTGMTGETVSTSASDPEAGAGDIAKFLVARNIIRQLLHHTTLHLAVMRLFERDRRTLFAFA